MKTTYRLDCIALLFGLFVAAEHAAGQTTSRETPKPVVREPVLRPGCLLPSPKLIAENAPFEVTVSVAVSSKGNAEAAEGIKSSGSREVDVAFVQAALKCSFEPGTEDGKPIQRSYSLKYQRATKGEPQGLGMCFMPGYPRAALRLGVGGTVEVAFRYPEGSTEAEVVVVKPSNFRPLNSEAVQTAKACLRNQAVQDSLQSRAWHAQAVVWVLEE